MTTTWVQGEQIDDRVIAARQALSDAEEDAAEASRAVDDLREKYALSLIEKGKLLIGQKRLAKLQEAHEQAKATLRAIEKVAAADKAQRDAARQVELAATWRVLIAECARLELEQRRIISDFLDEIAAVDLAIRQQQDTLRNAGGGGRMPVPVSQLEATYGPAVADLRRLLVRLLPSERELLQGTRP